MARKGQLNSNEKKAKLIAKYARKRADLLALIKNKNTSLAERFQAVLKLSALPRNSSPSRYRNRCELTGRARGYYNRFNVSRIVLRQLASAGMMPGVKKSSW
jgi:small subunit ribosomal protein S14